MKTQALALAQSSLLGTHTSIERIQARVRWLGIRLATTEDEHEVRQIARATSRIHRLVYTAEQAVLGTIGTDWSDEAVELRERQDRQT